MNHSKVSFFCVFLVFCFTFIIPVDFNGLYGIDDKLIFKLFRYVFVGLGLLLIFSFGLFYNRFLLFSLTVSVLILLVKYLTFNTVDTSILYLLSALLVTFHVFKWPPDKYLLERLIIVSSVLFVIQCIFYSFVYSDRVVSFSGDPNYTGFFLLLFFHYFFNRSNYIYSSLFLFLGVFTFSRVFLLSIFIYILAIFFARALRLKSYTFYTLLGYTMLIGVSFYAVIFVYEWKLPDYNHVLGFERFGNVFDTSNWIRFTANVVMLTESSFSEFFLGSPSSEPIYFEDFPNKTIFPHNTFQSLMYNFGFILSSLYVYSLTIIMDKSKNIIPLFYSVLIYQLFLGFGIFYGILLVVLYVFSMLDFDDEDKSKLRSSS